MHEPGLTSAQMLAMLAQARSAVVQLEMADSDVDMPELWACRGDAWQLCARDAWLASAAWQQVFDCELHWSTQSALAVGAANAVIDAVNWMIEKALAGINALAEAAN